MLFYGPSLSTPRFITSRESANGLENATMKNTDIRAVLFLSVISAIVVAAGACTKGANVNTNINANINTNVNANASGANVNAASAPSTIAAREPDAYRATIVF